MNISPKPDASTVAARTALLFAGLAMRCARAWSRMLFCSPLERWFLNYAEGVLRALAALMEAAARGEIPAPRAPARPNHPKLQNARRVPTGENRFARLPGGSRVVTQPESRDVACARVPAGRPTMPPVSSACVASVFRPVARGVIVLRERRRRWRAWMARQTHAYFVAI